MNDNTTFWPRDIKVEDIREKEIRDRCIAEGKKAMTYYVEAYISLPSGEIVGIFPTDYGTVSVLVANIVCGPGGRFIE